MSYLEDSASLLNYRIFERDYEQQFGSQYKPECIICLDDAADTDEIVNINTLDLFKKKCTCECFVHSHCLQKWIKSTPICPICRKSLANVKKITTSNSSAASAASAASSAASAASAASSQTLEILINDDRNITTCLRILFSLFVIIVCANIFKVYFL